MIILLYTITAVVVAVDIALILLWLFNFRKPQHGLEDTPLVSILIAARNEEENLGACLESLIALDYPADKVEVLVGDDMSEDQTSEIALAYASRYPAIRYVPIHKKEISGNGKANVLAQLFKLANSEFVFVTDADILVPPQWIKSMLQGLSGKTALVTGTSMVVGNGFLAYMQQLDWLYATGMLKVVSDINIPVTTMGNNMLIRKSVYEEIGGYEALDFSVTEDLELFNQIKNKYKTVNIFGPEVLNRSTPQATLKDLLIQRKRWMKGAFGLPLIMIVLLLLQASFFAVIIGMFIINPVIGWLVLGTRILLRLIFISLIVYRLDYRVNLIGSVIFEVFTAIFSTASLLYYIFSNEIEWKGRKY